MASTFGFGQHAFLDHQLGAGRPLGERRAFLGRLKDELDGARQPVADLRQDAGRRQQDRHVRVVPARVHDADRLPLVLGRAPCWRSGTSTSSRTGKPSMSARSATTGPGRPPLSTRDDAGAGDAGLRLEPEALEPFGDVLRGLDFAVGQLRALVEMAPPREQLRLDRGGEPVDFGLPSGDVAGSPCWPGRPLAEAKQAVVTREVPADDRS